MSSSIDFQTGFINPSFVDLTATPTVLTERQSGSVVRINTATGTFTLPALKAGLRFTFVLGFNGVGTLQIINSAVGNIMVGSAICGGAGENAKINIGAGLASVRFSTACVECDKIEMYCDGVNWSVFGNSRAPVASFATAIIFV